MQNNHWHMLATVTLFTVALALVPQTKSGQAFAAQPRAAKNFFLEPNRKSQPCFAGPQLSETELENRRIPDIRLLRTLPGLEADKRKQIDRLYKAWQQDTAELRTGMQSVQRQIAKLNELPNLTPSTAILPSTASASGTAPLPSIAPPVLPASELSTYSATSSDARISDSQVIDSRMTDSQNLPVKGTKVEDESSSKLLAGLKKEQKSLRSELLKKRKDLWEQIRPLLSEQNKADLEKMRRGQYMPASTTVSEGK